ncbi:U3 small nucleolar ribonucleoprotein protein MPP10 [Bombyx mandarina]|uniref:U3 small nucleolar ribonucleoprotein protein MPP10 n=1 Tax=Bombyx mandarina TaxID=7092 RepID=A0A6J2JLQ7_BOMMA|nr:U3 small nucleolar ribonucleoprotein protein MPP10 [Bombyx mandarina]
MACIDLEGILNKFNSYTDKPVKFLSVQKELKEDLKRFVKSVYDYTKSQEKSDKKKKSGALKELIVEDFDEEQIWQQIELQNSQRWDQIVWEVANSMSAKNELVFPVKVAKEKPKEILPHGVEPMVEDDEEKVSENIELEHGRSQRVQSDVPKKKTRPSQVDDKFFKLSEMEEFLLKEEKKQTNRTKGDRDSDEESIDFFEDDNEEEEDENVMYNDFFDQDGAEDGDYDMDQEIDDSVEDEEEEVTEQSNKKKRVRFSQPSIDDSDDNSVDSNKNNKVNSKTIEEKQSEFEQRQQRLKQHIQRLEEKTLKEASWQLKGEVDASKRPQNSLLQEVVDFDLTTRPAPIITEQTTFTLEDIIKRRIKDKAWDDVVKKEKPVDDQLAFRKKEILDHSKSKLSLAQVYEAEYLKQKQAASGEIVEEKEPEAHKEIREAMSQLFSKLDALSHYHYTPKAVQPEVTIVSNTPAISMEEVAPVATSDAALLAPEEVKRKQKGDLISKEERTKTDKNRERRKKKKLQKKKGQVTKVTDSRNTTKSVEVSDKSVKTSKAFFEQLNDNTKSLIKKNKLIKNKGQ